MLSTRGSNGTSSAELERLKPTLSLLGEAVACGRLGSSRAIDYAVVDLALVCFNSFLSNAEMREREGVDRTQLYEHMGKRLATVPGPVKGCSGMKSSSTVSRCHPRGPKRASR